MKVERVKANLDFQTVYQALGLLLENVDNAKKAEYEATLSLDNKGLPVFNTSDSKVYVWTGAAFVQIGAGGGGGSGSGLVIDLGFRLTGSSVINLGNRI